MHPARFGRRLVVVIYLLVSLLSAAVQRVARDADACHACKEIVVEGVSIAYCDSAAVASSRLTACTPSGTARATMAAWPNACRTATGDRAGLAGHGRPGRDPVPPSVMRYAQLFEHVLDRIGVERTGPGRQLGRARTALLIAREETES
jgi:hypothetical protein